MGIHKTVKIFGEYKWTSRAEWERWESTLTWQDLFALIAPYLLENPNDTLVRRTLKASILEKSGKEDYFDANINDQIYQTVKVQLVALGLVNVNYTQTTQGGMALFWSLTPKGKQLLFLSQTIKRNAG